MPDPTVQLNNPQPNPPTPTDTDAGSAPDVNGAAPAGAPPAPGGAAPAAGPTPPRKEGVGQGFARGMAGETYVTDAAGNVTNARTTAPSGKGMFGSILGGIVFGALQGAHSARPGGIPSHELGGGAGQGAESASEALKARDVKARGNAQQNFQNQQVAKKQANEDLA